MKLATSVQDHLDEFNTILIDLENLDVDVNDEDKVILLVISLPASYKHFKEIMLYGNRETLSFDDVKFALLSKQKYDDDVEPESGEGLVARGRSSDRGESSNKNKKHRSQSRGKYSNKSCKYCKKLDHIVFDCYKLKNKLKRECKRNNEKKPEKAVEVAIATGDSDGDVYLAIDTEKSRDELIGNIQVKMHDSVVRTITRVRHVPDLKRNLISLSTLKANRCGLYVLKGTVVYSTAGVATSKASLDDSKLWHYRLGHMGEKCMKNLAKKGLIKVSCNQEFCEHCVFGKQKRHKDEVFSTFMEWKVLIENQTGKKIKKLRTDNGLKFCGENFNALYRKTIMEKVRCMLSHANLDKDFWVEVATTATYLINHSPHRSLDDNIIEILWSGNSVDYSNLRDFGCPVYVHVNEGKLVPRAVKFIFLGYGSGVKGYRVWCPDPKYRKIIHSKDVTFNEDVVINSGKDFAPPHNVDNNHTKGKVEFELDVENSTHTPPPFNDEHIKPKMMATCLQVHKVNLSPSIFWLGIVKGDNSKDLQDLGIINVT
nr:retrovirus-related Pol polyprotein from transposon TNT 1-94 [Tanacetum cinerariifolium]